MGVHTLLLALGANQAGAWGPPGETLERARRELCCAGVRILASSPIYHTLPLGPGGQSPYLNAVLLAEAHMAPAALLRLIKRLERRAGRRLSRRWGPRPLDIDILVFGELRLRDERLTLPHPRLAERAFALVPLAEIAPGLEIDGVTAVEAAERSDQTGIEKLDG